ncbi:T. brucei spp.-specific protein [Trypanosoma brucei gambiense DAL972]|uniref:Invariant surface glycoprotein n=2 Tax=Trypanosoma brucei TaxID=5691 RepID=Q57VF0_TRYB2|nr:T. brucei spp.-specific protein [Trypanosoma brucei gambiense DAL972]XP_844736.1 hypothetical protein Tb927.5.620 [Trypanosoma brucei brucei TREU927]AAX70419.1 hypothetical protein Tb927.5.620 [Trypanosoma brucei]AAZ11177.1 hypothetical protein Tb927.5.620 [Trypanosoma brucei brucei TREU927]CBH10941.1 T. brucei spp.-specific protein [Trypanosoma brucei gambiense DAL972]|eukprot:XP_011773228.1 T. brucei spp.-specific protein [Trypanosoma brucei gambiense DAL972]
MSYNALCIGHILLVFSAVASASEESYKIDRYKADRKLDKEGAIALCKLRDVLTNISEETTDYLVEEVQKMGESLKTDMDAINYYVKRVRSLKESGREDAKINESDSNEIDSLCKEAKAHANKKSRDQVDQTVAKIRRVSGIVKDAATKTLGDENELEDHDNADGIFKVFNWHCGGDRIGEVHAGSQSCDVIGFRKNFSAGQRNVISCKKWKDEYGETIPHENVTVTQMESYLSRWFEARPKRVGEDICKDGEYHSPHSCTVWEGWVTGYEETMEKMEELRNNIKKLNRIRYDGETQLWVLYELFEALRNPETVGPLPEVLENINKTKKSRLKNKSVGNNLTQYTLLDEDFQVNETEREHVDEARDYFAAANFAKLMMYIFIPVGAVLILVVAVTIIVIKRKCADASNAESMAGTLPGDKVI